MLSVMFPTMPGRTTDLVAFGRLVADRNFDRLWMGQSLAIETHQALAYLAGAGIRIPVGIAVSLTPLRHPYEAAVAARSLAILTRHPVVAAFGTGGDEFTEDLLGAAYPRPANAVGEYLSVARQTLAGTYFEFDGNYHQVRTGLIPLPHPRVELGAGVLRPGMARIAGTLADVAVTWLTPPTYVADVLLPALRAGAHRAGRPAPRVVTIVPVAVARPGRDPSRLAYLGSGAHLTADHYVKMLHLAGVDVDPDKPEIGADALVESGIFGYGNPTEIASTLAAYRDAGVSEIVLNPGGVAVAEGIPAAVRDLTELTHAIR